MRGKGLFKKFKSKKNNTDTTTKSKMIKIILILILVLGIGTVLYFKTSNSNIMIVDKIIGNLTQRNHLIGRGTVVTADSLNNKYFNGTSGLRLIRSGNSILYCGDIDKTLHTTQTIRDNGTSWTTKNNSSRVKWTLENIHLGDAVTDNDIKNLQYYNMKRIIMQYEGNSGSTADQYISSIYNDPYSLYAIMQNVIWLAINNSYDSTSGGRLADYQRDVMNYYNGDSLSEIITGDNVSINKNSVSINQNGMIGPFRITSNGKIYGIKADVKVNGSSTSYSLVNASGARIFSEDLHNNYYYSTYSGDVYVKLNSSFSNNTQYNVSISFNGIYYNTTRNVL